METVLTYVPLFLDVIAIIFLVLCLKLGYDDGICKVIKSAGTFLTMVLSAWLAKLLYTFMTPVVKLFNSLLSGVDVAADTRAILASFIVIVILFVIFFVVLMSALSVISKKTAEKRKNISGKPLDRILGLVLLGIFGILLIAFLAWIFYDVTSLISTSQMRNTIIINFISEIF